MPGVSTKMWRVAIAPKAACQPIADLQTRIRCASGRMPTTRRWSASNGIARCSVSTTRTPPASITATCAEAHQLAGHVAAPAAVLDRAGALDHARELDRRPMPLVAAADRPAEALAGAQRGAGPRRRRRPQDHDRVPRARREQRLRG